MREFFQAVDSCNPNVETRTVTVIRGERIGEKAVLSGGAVVWLSDPNGFLAGHETGLKQLTGTGIRDFEGASIYTERVGHGKKMVICGAGHVAIPIVRLAKMIGMYVTVLDDREQFTKTAAAAGADRTMCGPFGENLRRIEGDPDTYFVIVTRGHSFDRECLTEILRKPNAYIGMMGSKRRISMDRQNMIDAGYDPALINRVHAPIGLDIGGETPEEIAISILGEIIQVKNENRDFSFPSDIMTAILGTEHVAPLSQRMVLATIVARRGSAPRQAGTKMLVLEDGSIINTIGGGLLEGKAIQRAVQMLEKEHPDPVLYHARLKADDAAEEGEVCGGDLDLFLEEV